MKFKIALLFSSILVGFGVLELGLRVYDYLAPKEPVYHSLNEDGYALLKVSSDTFIFANEPGKKTHFKTNREGFAGENYDIQSKKFRVAILGDSFAQAEPFVDYEHTFSYLLQQQLNLRDDGNLHEIMNFGIMGNSTVDAIYYYDKYVKKYNPKVVLLALYLGNDFDDNRKYMSQEEEILNAHDISKLNLKKKPPPPANQTSKNNQELDIIKSMLNVFLKSKIFHTFYQGFLINNDWFFGAKWFIRTKFLGISFEPPEHIFINIWPYTDLGNPIYSKQKDAIEFTVAVIQNLGRRVETNGGKFGVVIIPSAWQVDEKLTRRLTRFNSTIDLFVPNTILKDKLAKEFPVLDLSSAFSYAINKEDKEVYIRGIWHFTEEGNVIAARELTNFIQNNF